MRRISDNSILENMGKEFKAKYPVTYLTAEEWVEHMKKFKKLEESEN
jgi:hypothetical protein